MKILKIAFYGAFLAATLAFTQAADSSSNSGSSSSSSSTSTRHAKRPKLTAEQKQLRKDMLAKYDANKDGKLDKEERAKFSDEDKQKMKKAGLIRTKRANHGKASSKSTATHDSNSSK
jgi:hypothetical protein